MRKVAKIIFMVLAALFLISILGFGCFYVWHGWVKFHQSKQTREFYELVDASKQETLDLRNFRPGEWDELIFWEPYGDICAYGIDGYEKGGPNCQSSTDDGECYLLFVQRNSLAFTIPLNRKKFDLRYADYVGRVARRDAFYKFDTKGDWPRASLVGNAKSKNLEPDFPADVQDIMDRKSCCEHWAGEPPFDDARKKEIEGKLQQCKCAQFDGDLEKIESKYKENKEFLKAIEEAGSAG